MKPRSKRKGHRAQGTTTVSEQSHHTPVPPHARVTDQGETGEQGKQRRMANGSEITREQNQRSFEKELETRHKSEVHSKTEMRGGGMSQV